LSHFHHRLNRKRGSKRLRRKDVGHDRVGAALDCAQQLPSGRTAAPCNAATQTSKFELCGFLQLNSRQMSPTSQVRNASLPGLSAGCGQGQSGQGYGMDSR